MPTHGTTRRPPFRQGKNTCKRFTTTSLPPPPRDSQLNMAEIRRRRFKTKTTNMLLTIINKLCSPACKSLKNIQIFFNRASPEFA